MIDFFISYNGADRNWAEWIAWQVEDAGYSVTIQAWDFHDGQNFVNRMDHSVAGAQRLLAVLSPEWLNSEAAQSEWRPFFKRDFSGDQSLIMLVAVKECVPKGLLEPIVRTNLVDLDEKSAKDKLRAALLNVPLPEQKADVVKAGARGRERQKPLQEPPFPGSILRNVVETKIIDYSHLVRVDPPYSQVDDELYSIVFSEDGQWLAAGSHCTAWLWNLGNPGGQAPYSTKGHDSYVYSVAFSRDSRRLVTGGEDGYVRVWSLNSRDLSWELDWEHREHTEAVYSVKFSRDGSKIASGGYDGRVLLWNAERGETLRSGGRDIANIGRVTSLAFSPDDQLLVIGTLRNDVWIFDINADKGRRLGRHNSSVECVVFSPNGKLVASCGLDKAVCVWEVDSVKKKPLWRKEEHEYLVRSVAFSPDGSTLASVGWDKLLFLWDSENGNVRIKRPTSISDSAWHSDWIWSVAFSHDGIMLASGGSDGRIVAWQVASSRSPNGVRR